MATLALVSWSFAELSADYPSSAPNPCNTGGKGQYVPDQAECAHANRLEVGIPRGDLKGRPKDLGAHEFGHGGRFGCEFVTWCFKERATRDMEVRGK
jgi:hypothetical protein